MARLSFSTSEGRLEVIQRRVNAVCDLTARLPGQVFRTLRPISLFSADELLTVAFPETIFGMARNAKDPSVCLYQIDPGPDFYLNEFGFYSAAEIGIEEDPLDVLDLFSWAPPEAPADALLTTGGVIVWAGASRQWAVWVDRYVEIAIVAVAESVVPLIEGVNTALPLVPAEDALGLIDITFRNGVSESYRSTFLANYGHIVV